MRKGFLLFYWVFFLLVVVCGPVSASINPFPTYPSIRANVEFWKRVYSEYHSNQGFIHDSKNLEVIYEVLDIKDRQLRGSARANRKKIKQVKAGYRKILTDLARGKKAATKEEKRVLALFNGNHGPEVLKEAAGNIRFQLCLNDRFKEGVIRSGRYLDEIKRILKKHKLPLDLAYLPHVESSFNYKAYSKFGAAGIWQFIRSTGRRFLTISYTLDERRDPILASHAAAKYLKENYKKLGTWPLALTAYNHGASGMARAKSKHGGYEAIFNKYDSRRFGFASRNFYSEFLAAREVAKHYQRYFKGLKMDSKVKTTQVKLAGYAAIDDLANYFKVDPLVVRELNPASNIVPNAAVAIKQPPPPPPPPLSGTTGSTLVTIAPTSWRESPSRRAATRCRTPATAGSSTARTWPSSRCT